MTPWRFTVATLLGLAGGGFKCVLDKGRKYRGFSLKCLVVNKCEEEEVGLGMGNSSD